MRSTRLACRDCRTGREVAEQRDRAARALFSATEIVTPNKFATKFGKDVPMTKYADYWRRYQQPFQKQANRLAKELSTAYAKNPKAGDPKDVYGRTAYFITQHDFTLAPPRQRHQRAREQRDDNI
jgi:hypothetical protein